MKNLLLLCFLFMMGMVTISCGKDDPDPVDEFDNQFSFELDGVPYSFTEFEITLDTATVHRVFIRKIDGANTFTFNFLLDWGIGTHGLNWYDGSSFFFARIASGDYHTVNPLVCPLVITRNDKVKEQIEATFSGIGAKPPTTDEITITNGVLKIQY